jgi:hypothetical protein
VAQLGVGDGVERAGGDELAHAEDGEAPSELARRLAREGEGEHVAGLGRARCHPVGDAAGQDTGLARTGPGEDAHRGARRADRLLLGGRQPLQQRVGVHETERTEGV